MAAPENDKDSSVMNCSDNPPPLRIRPWKLCDLPKKRKHWSTDHLPVDILLLTVEDCEFLACYYYLKDSFKSHQESIGDVYFGKMGEEGDKSLKVALVKCCKEFSHPGGSQTTAKNAISLLRPKATFLVGFCYSPSSGKAQRGDVVISSILTTEHHQTPVSRNFGKLVITAAHGWKAPLQNPDAHEVKVHCDGKIFSHTDLDDAEQQCQSDSGAIAVEILAGKGLFAAAHEMKMEWLVVKGVCDFVHGSASTNDSWKTFACAMAASVVSHMLNDSNVFEKWPHHRDISAREESCNSDDSSNKRRKVEEPLNVEKCREQLRSHYDTLCKEKTIPWDDSSSIEIIEIYTPLSWFRDERTPRGVTQEQLKDYTDMFKGNKHHPKPTRMLVYGRPGIGKSTFCKKIAYDWMKGSKEILLNFYILLLIKLRDVCNMENIRDVLCASKLLASDGPISVDSLYDYMRKNQDKVLLILDGYDEYSCAKENSPILEIWRGEQLRDCGIIITTRQLECDELASPSQVQFRIHGFSWPQIKVFAGKYLTSEQDVESFTAYLTKNDLEDLAKIPLLLLMLCLLWKVKHDKGLPTSRADIYKEFTQTMLNHKVEKEKSKRFQEVSSEEAREDLSILGKVAFDALLQGSLFARCNELPDSISRTLEKLREVGLFQIVNITSLNHEKGVYFIHKSIQEFLAAWHMKEEVLSMNGDWITSLSRLESMEKILKVIEVLKFVCELSTDAASAVFHHVVAVEKMGPWLDSESSKLTQSTGKLRKEKELCTTLVSHSYFCCSPEKRRDLFSKFLSHTKGIMRLDSSQVNIVAKEHLLKSAEAPKYIFFPHLSSYSDQSYRDLITVAEDVKAVVVSSSGEKKASDFLRRHAGCPLMNFLFMKKRKIILYMRKIAAGDYHGPFPTKMLRELMSSKAESTQEKRVGDRLNEHDKETATCSTENTDSITGPIPQSLSRLKDIFVSDIGRQELEMLIDILPLFSSLEALSISNVSRIVDAQLMEALVSSIKYGKRLDTLFLTDANLTCEPAAAIARSLHQAPNLTTLGLSNNPLGKGVSVLTRHLSSCPDLISLFLEDVKMTKKQIKDLSRAVRQKNIHEVYTAYHDEKGNVKPEDEWQTWDGIEIGLATDSEDEHESGSSTDSEDKQESWSVTDSKD